MTKMLITGASGQLGQSVVDHLIERGAQTDIVALVRNEAQAARFADLDIATRYGDYNDQDSLFAAFAGIDRLLLISSSDLGNRISQHRAVIDAARTAGVGYIAYTSLLNAANSPLGLAADHKATEQMIRDSGMRHTILRNGWYTGNIMMGITQDLAMGQHFGAAGDGKFSLAPREDFAQAAAIVLLGGHDGQVLELAGDVGVTMADYAAILSEVSGTPVAYVDMPEAAYAQALIGAGLPEDLAYFLASTDVMARQDALFDDSRTLSKLLGRPTTPVADSLRAALHG